ncbi:MAG: peptidyl-prolyl cis-trans isomerase [Desulfovibrionaceae bacterium]
MKRTLRIDLTLLVLLLAATLAAACSDESDDMGVVARVNGRPITLAQLEFQHDLLHMDSGGTFVPSVEALRAEYGHILGDLIVLELVSQDLEERGIPVTDEEVRAAEAKVRADYPEGAFDQVIIEEYIDLASWRQQLRYTLAREKFNQQVLRPHIQIDYREAEKYYEDHLDDFRVPASVHVVTVRSLRHDDVERALKLYRAGHDPKVLRGDLDGVTVREMTVPRENLSATWHDALQELPAGEASPIMEVSSGFEALVLLDSLPAKVLDPSTAYPQVEERLLEQKLQVAFDEWLKKKLATADIRISSRLLPAVEKPGEGVAPAPAIVPSLPPVPEGQTEVTPPPDVAEDKPEGMEPDLAQPRVEGDGMPLSDEDEEGGPPPGEDANATAAPAGRP